MSRKKSSDEVYAIWEKFMNGDKNVKGLRKEILLSWKRSREAGVDPYEKGELADEHTLMSLRNSNQHLLEVVSPFMDLMVNFTRNTGFVVSLTDKDGFIIALNGDCHAIEQGKNNNFVLGVNRLEKKAGTNAISLALTEGKPFQILGPEHFKKTHHDWTCSSAPIHDTHGQIIGVLNLSGHCSLLHKHTLGMVISMVQAIEREFRIREKNAILKLANERLKAVVDSVSEGVVALDKQGVIIEANAKFRQMFRVNQADLSGVTISEILKNPASMLAVLKTGKEYFEREESLSTLAGTLPAMTTGRKIVDDHGEVVGVVGIIKEKKEVYRMVNRLAGSKAIFTFQDIIHQEPQMEKTISIAKAVAEADTRLLLEGESGTGKELFAQSIHNASPRHTGPFVAVNCSAIPRELIESELFGYVEGAFTGAKKGGKPGKFELADGGTLFLDEINSMPLDLQVKLLRVLQQNEITRLGGEQAIPVNVRIIAASNKPLEELVQEGHFRLDLFYRLGVVVLKIPPLRERIKDIPLLFLHLLQKITQSTGKTVEYSMEELIPILCAYDWPGNVRELENYIERAVILAHNGIITPEHFPEKMILTNHSEAVKKNFLAMKERETIEKVLEIFNGNISKAAKSLGISRSTLYTKIKTYGLRGE